MSVKNSRLPVVMLKLPGQPAIPAGIVGSAVGRDGQKANIRQSFDVTFADGKGRKVFGFNVSGLIAKHVRGIGPEGATKVNAFGASNLDDARFFAVYPHTGRVRPIKGAANTTERNGLSIVKIVAQVENNPALTGLGDHTIDATYAEAKPRKAITGKAGEMPEADYGLDDALMLELLGIVDKRDAKPAEQPEAMPEGAASEIGTGQPA